MLTLRTYSVVYKIAETTKKRKFFWHIRNKVCEKELKIQLKIKDEFDMGLFPLALGKSLVCYYFQGNAILKF